MRLREFIGLVGCVTAWPLAASAEPDLPSIGLLFLGKRDAYYPSGFFQLLADEVIE
jgi:hypothetical protein